MAGSEGAAGESMMGENAAGLGTPLRVIGGRRARQSRSYFFLWEVVLVLSIATWNVPGLFGTMQSSQERLGGSRGLLRSC